MGDATLLAKWRFHEDEARGWSLALRPELSLPSGSIDKGLGNDRTGAALTLVSSLERGSWTWLANAGMAWNNNRVGDRTQLWSASTAVLWAATPKLSLVADIGASRAADREVGAEKFGLLGAIWHMGEDIDLDLGWRRSFGARPTAHTVGAGLTVRW